MNKKRNFVIYVQLHFLFMLYSLGGVCSKIAAQQKLFSWKWIGLYGIILIFLCNLLAADIKKTSSYKCLYK